MITKDEPAEDVSEFIDESFEGGLGRMSVLADIYDARPEDSESNWSKILFWTRTILFTQAIDSVLLSTVAFRTVKTKSF